jgi:hypothetical protein
MNPIETVNFLENDIDISDGYNKEYELKVNENNRSDLKNAINENLEKIL